VKVLAILCLLLASCANYDTRIAKLESLQNYIVEVVKNRRISSARCVRLSDDGMACQLATNERCRCYFLADDQDRENAAFEAAVARAQKQAAAAAEAETEAKAKAKNQQKAIEE